MIYANFWSLLPFSLLLCPTDASYSGLPELQFLSPQFNKSTMLCLASPFLCHGPECAPRQKVGAVVGFASFVCVPFSQGSQFCAAYSTVSEDNIIEGQVWSQLFLYLIYLKF